MLVFNKTNKVVIVLFDYSMASGDTLLTFHGSCREESQIIIEYIFMQIDFMQIEMLILLIVFKCIHSGAYHDTRQ